MGMNIKNEEAHRLASELASIYGETLTEAVTVALRERLARATKEDRGKRMRELARQFKELAPTGMTSENATDFLYDELGLPI